MTKYIALIPAKLESRRFPNKNIINLNGHPLISYTISSAINCKIFDKVIVSTDSEEIAKIAKSYGATVPTLRPKEMSETNSPDIQWVTLAVKDWLNLDNSDIVAILRPTNPLRKSSTINSALKLYEMGKIFDSLRAIRPVIEHPSKMWRGSPGGRIIPLDDSINQFTQTNSHSSPFQTLEKLWIQNASLEILKVKTITESKSISGNKILGFEMPGYEGFDLNYPEDFIKLKEILKHEPLDVPIKR